MPTVKVDERKPFDVTLRYFKRACQKAGIISELRERKHYIKPTEKRKIAKRAAIGRAKKANRMPTRQRYS